MNIDQSLGSEYRNRDTNKSVGYDLTLQDRSCLRKTGHKQHRMTKKSILYYTAFNER